MKKRVIVLFTAVMLMVCCTMTVFAQPSAEGTPVVSITDVVDKSNKELDSQSCHEIRAGGLTGNELKLAQDIVKPENLKTILTEAEAQKNWTSFNFDVYLYDVLEKKEVEWEDGDYHFPITITFKVPGVKEGSNVKVLHYYPDSWHAEKIVKVGTDEVTVIFEHLSPVVIMVDKPETAGMGTNTPDSPKTGDVNLAIYGVLIACSVMTGAVILRKKENE